MIYGIFGFEPIPPNLRRRFAERIKVEGSVAVLVGACNTEQEVKDCQMIGSNETRRIHATKPRAIRWIGLYAYHVSTKATGWPVHSFIRQPIYRKISLWRDVRITDRGITLRLRTRKGVRFIERSWDQLFRLRERRKI